MSTTKPTTSSSSTSQSTGNTAPDFSALLQAAASMGGGVTGNVFTKQEGNAVVQGVFQQILGRNATGNEYAKAMSIVMGQSQDTSSDGRGQAVTDFVQNLPEYQAREDNKYLDAMYNAVAADVRKVRQ